MAQNNSQRTSDRVPANLLDTERIVSEIEDYSKHEDFRKRVKDIVEECIDSVSFMDKVRSYAKRELDERVFKNGFVILIYFLGLIVSALVGGFVTKIFFK